MQSTLYCAILSNKFNHREFHEEFQYFKCRRSSIEGFANGIGKCWLLICREGYSSYSYGYCSPCGIFFLAVPVSEKTALVISPLTHSPEYDLNDSAVIHPVVTGTTPILLFFLQSKSSSKLETYTSCCHRSFLVDQISFLNYKQSFIEISGAMKIHSIDLRKLRCLYQCNDPYQDHTNNLSEFRSIADESALSLAETAWLRKRSR